MRACLSAQARATPAARSTSSALGSSDLLTVQPLQPRLGGYSDAFVAKIDLQAAPGCAIWPPPDFFAQRGVIVANQRRATGPVMEDWVYVAGLPLSEPYWVRARIGGVERDVLVQVFERRVLTYTPDNPAAWRVEMGNVGRHYLHWRYGLTP